MLNNFKQLSFLSFNKVGILLFGILYVPLIINKYGIENYGIFIFHQTIIGFFIICFKYGFEIKGIKILGEKENKHYYLVNILGLQHILFMIGLTLVSITTLFIQKPLVFILLYLSAYREIGFSDFYFIEGKKTEKLLILNTLSRIPILYILLFHSFNFQTFILIYSISFLVIGLINTGLLLHRRIHNIHFRTIKNLFLEGLYFFSSKIISGIKDKLMPIAIGTLIGTNVLAIYDIGLKLINIGTIPVGIINQFFIRLKEREKLVRLILLLLLWTLIYLITLFAYRNEITIYLGINQIEKIKLLPIFVTIGLVALNTSSFIGTNILVAKDLDQYYFNSIVGTIITTFTLFFIAVVFKFTKWYHLMFLISVVYLFEALFRYYYFRKYA